MKLTDNEIRDVIRLLEAGKPLPDAYRFLLFDDKREVELVWNGKTNEVCNIVLPFQVIEQVDEPRAEKPEDTKLQTELFSTDARGRQLKGWTNKLIWGDNKLILSSLKNGPLRDEIEKQGGIKLIYIDPPFDVGADFSMDIEIGDETFTKKPNILEEIAYRDTWGKGTDSFIAMLYERLILLRDVLSEDGTLYMHLGPSVSTFIEVALQEVFGRDRTLGTIIWQRATAHGNAGVRYATITDRILSATKSDTYTWNKPYQKYSQEYMESHYSSVEPETGRRFTLRDLTASMSRASASQIYEWRGVRPVGSRCWAYTQKRMDELYNTGKVVFTSGKMPRMKLYLDEMPGIPATDLWSDVSPLNSQAREDTQYPTQKPEALIERIIRASSNEGDLVLDVFSGSGTTAALAEKLSRKWIAADLGKFAVHTTRKRMRRYRKPKYDVERLRVAITWFGSREASSVTPGMIDSHLHANAMQRGWAASTINHHRSVISLAYRLARRDRKVEVNPVRDVPHRRESNSRVRSLNACEENSLRVVIRKNFAPHEIEFDFALQTGLRMGSQFQLTWDMVDWDDRVLRIPRTKNEEALQLPLSADALQILLRLKSENRHPHRVFVSLDNGKPLNYPKHWFVRAVRMAKIVDFHWHDLRHTFATRLRSHGVPLEDIADLLGHKGLAMTRRYAHPDVERLRRALGSVKRTDPTTDTGPSDLAAD